MLAFFQYNASEGDTKFFKDLDANQEADKNQALQQLSATADEVKLPNPPYSPTIEQLSLSYTATQTIRFDKPELNHPKDLFFHLCPFGQSPVAATQGAYLMPNYEGQGQLYIGIEGLRVPQNLSLLFQLAEGSGNPDLALPTIQWHYLNGAEVVGCEEAISPRAE